MNKDGQIKHFSNKKLTRFRPKRDNEQFEPYISPMEWIALENAYLKLLVVVDPEMSEKHGKGLTDYIQTILFMVCFRSFNVIKHFSNDFSKVIEQFKHQTMNNLIDIVISDILYLHDVEQNPV